MVRLILALGTLAKAQKSFMYILYNEVMVHCQAIAAVPMLPVLAVDSSPLWPFWQCEAWTAPIFDSKLVGRSARDQY